MNGVDSLGSNQECKIGYIHSHSRVSQCLASIGKLGNRRSSEGFTVMIISPQREQICLFLSSWLGISK